MSAKPKLSRALKTSSLKLLEKVVGKTTVNPSEITPEKIRRILIIRRHDDLKKPNDNDSGLSRGEAALS